MTNPTPPPNPPAADAAQQRVAWGFLLIAIGTGASGTLALSRTQGFTQWEPALLTVAAYAACFLALTRALRVIPVSIAYAVWSGLGIALVSLIAWLAFDQPLNAGELLGIGLILVGTVVIQLFSRSAQAG